MFGARGAGKNTLPESLLPPDRATWSDLNDLETYARIVRSPELFENELWSVQKVSPEKIWVVVDEIQRCPALLNSVQRLGL